MMKRLPIGVVWKLEEGSSSSGVVLVIGPWFKIRRSVAKSPRVPKPVPKDLKESGAKKVRGKFNLRFVATLGGSRKI
ncbi:hypothetical protein TNCV_4654011 [Trichonephila clavipes]|nr:hypothetical protein TNCV_4654011 [Trichonephila clavipes]